MKRYFFLLVLALFMILSFAKISSSTLHLLILILMWSVIGMSWNLLAGFCGQVSFGHAVFFGIGAYITGILHAQFGVSHWWGIPASVLIVSSLALSMGYICLRLRGPFFALATLALNVVVQIVSKNETTFVFEERTWIEKIGFFYLILAMAIGTFLLIQQFMGSKFGIYLLAIREDQDSAETIGINTLFYKTLALLVSAVLTGIAGAFYASYLGVVDPKLVFSVQEISMVAMMVGIVGGVATFWGPIIGSVIIVSISELMRSFPLLVAAHQTILGVLLIITLLFMPNGFMSLFRRRAR